MTCRVRDMIAMISCVIRIGRSCSSYRNIKFILTWKTSTSFNVCSVLINWPACLTNLSNSLRDFSALAPSDISLNFGAAVAANVAIKAVVVANSARNYHTLFTVLMILFSVCFILILLLRLFLRNKIFITP